MLMNELKDETGAGAVIAIGNHTKNNHTTTT